MQDGLTAGGMEGRSEINGELDGSEENGLGLLKVRGLRRLAECESALWLHVLWLFVQSTNHVV